MINIDKTFLKGFGILIFFSVFLTCIILIYFNNKAITVAVLSGLLMAIFNIILGYLSIEYAHNKSFTKFMKILVGGMGIRLTLLIIGVLIFIKWLNLLIIPFIVSLFVFYIIFLIFEIIYIEKRIKSKIS